MIQHDGIINNRVKKMLALDPFNRRTVLNRWLEQLYRNKASEHLRQALSWLLDDKIAAKVLELINNHKDTNN